MGGSVKSGSASLGVVVYQLPILHRLLILVALFIAFAVAFFYGVEISPLYTFWGVLASGFLWWLASAIPAWRPSATLAPATFNSAAASAAVFAGMAALPSDQLAVVLRLATWLHHR